MKIYFLIFFLLLQYSQIKAQNIASDINIAIDANAAPISNTAYYKGNLNSQKVMQKDSNTKGFAPVFFIAKLAMYAYQNYLSPQLFKECAFEITCSNFCKLSIHNHGLFKGILMAADRLMRCNPYSLMDIDAENISPQSNKIIDQITTLK